MSEANAVPVVTEDEGIAGIEAEEEQEEQEFEEAPARVGRIRNTVAHVPGPRRKRKFAPAPEVAEEETVAEAPAEAEVSDEGVDESMGFEAPMTLGSVDG